MGNCLCEGGLITLSARRPYVGYVLARLHIVNRVNWAHTHQRWLKQQLNSVLFSDESRFRLPFIEVMAGFEYTVGEMSVMPSYASCCVIERDGFGGGHSVLVWEGIAHGFRTNLVFIEGNLNAQRNPNSWEARYPTVSK